MLLPKNNTQKKEGEDQLIAVAIDKDKGSQNALKWAIDHLLQRGQTILLIHVKQNMPYYSVYPSYPSSRVNSIVDNERSMDASTKELFLPFRCFCTRKEIQTKDIVLQDVDVAKALTEYVTRTAIDTLVLGASAEAGFLRFKATDIPGNIVKGAPDFCNVYVISKGKVQSMRSASRPPPFESPLRYQLLNQKPSSRPASPEPYRRHPPPSALAPITGAVEKPPFESHRKSNGNENDAIRTSLTTRRGYNGRSYGEISFSPLCRNESFARPNLDRLFPSLNDNQELGDVRFGPRKSLGAETDMNHSNNFESLRFGRRSLDFASLSEFSSFCQESDRLSTSSQNMEDIEAEVRSLKLELKQTMDMYNMACKEALTAKQKLRELQRWKVEEERRLEEARLAEEAALAIAEKEKEKSREAIEAAKAAKRIAELAAFWHIAVVLTLRKDLMELQH